MSNETMHEKDVDINELAEEVLFLEDLEMDKDIREWLQTPTVQFKEYVLGEPDSEIEYLAMLEDLSRHLMER